MINKVLSISVAAYNVEKYISKTIQSVIEAKNIGKIQLIIVNDGSKDNTFAIANEYARKYRDSITVIDKENGGHGSTINNGIENAIGKYFMVLDGDDWLDTDELDRIIPFMESNNTDMILLNSVNCYEGGTNIRIVQFPKYRYDTLYKESDFGRDLRVGLSCSIIKTELFKNSKLRCVEKCFYDDLQYDAIIMYLANNFIYKNCFLYQYRLGREGQSVSMEGFQKHIDMQLLISKELNSFYDSCLNISDGKKRAILNCCYAIEKSIIATYLSFAPTKEINNELNNHISYIKKTDVFNVLRKDYIPFKIYCMTKSYPITSWIYRILRK